MSDVSDVRADISRWRAEVRSEANGEHDGERHQLLVAASFTAHAIDPGLGLALLDAGGPAPAVHHHDYNQIFQLCLAPEQHVPADVDDVVVLWRIEDVFERDFHRWTDGDDDAIAALVEGAEALGRAVGACRERIDANVIVSSATSTTRSTAVSPMRRSSDFGSPRSSSPGARSLRSTGATGSCTGSRSPLGSRTWSAGRSPR